MRSLPRGVRATIRTRRSSALSTRLGNAAAPPERRASLQEAFPDEVADEARSPGEAQPSSERNGTGGETDAFSAAPLCTEVVQ
jgi:hypothetical protein